MLLELRNKIQWIVPKTCSRHERRTVERYILATLFIWPLLLLLKSLLDVIPDGRFSLIGKCFYMASSLSFIAFLLGKISFTHMRWIVAITFIWRCIQQSAEAHDYFENMSWFDSYSFASLIHVGPAWSLLGLGLSFPSILMLVFCWSFLLGSFMYSTHTLQSHHIFLAYTVSFGLQTGLGLFWTVTELVYEQELEAALHQSQQSNKSKTKFISWLSHDLRTPLVGLNGFLDELQSHVGLTENQNALISNALHCTQIISGLITHLLDFSMLESGEFVIQREPFTIGNTFLFLRNLLESMAKNKQLNFSFQMDSSITSNDFVWGDQLRICQILTNLGVNAIRYTPSGGSVFVRIHRKLNGYENEDNRMRLNIVVGDTGPGIPASDLAGIFHPFHQMKTRGSTPGTGLGLYVLSEIVKAMKGTVRCESSPSGTWFYVESLIFDKVKEQELKQIEKKTNSQFWSWEEAQRYHILLVEDNVFNQMVLRRLVESIGFQITVASDGQEAIQTFAANPNKFNMILMDIQMPVKDGIEATREIRNLECELNTALQLQSGRTTSRDGARGKRRVSIVALTATTFRGDLEQAINAGCDETLSKPIKKHVLEECCWRRLKFPQAFSECGNLTQ